MSPARGAVVLHHSNHCTPDAGSSKVSPCPAITISNLEAPRFSSKRRLTKPLSSEVRGDACLASPTIACFLARGESGEGQACRLVTPRPHPPALVLFDSLLVSLPVSACLSVFLLLPRWVVALSARGRPQVEVEVRTRPGAGGRGPEHAIPFAHRDLARRIVATL